MEILKKFSIGKKLRIFFPYSEIFLQTFFNIKNQGIHSKTWTSTETEREGEEERYKKARKQRKGTRWRHFILIFGSVQVALKIMTRTWNQTAWTYRKNLSPDPLSDQARGFDNCFKIIRGDVFRKWFLNNSEICLRAIWKRNWPIKWTDCRENESTTFCRYKYSFYSSTVMLHCLEKIFYFVGHFLAK